jgi:hypothetical protein
MYYDFFMLRLTKQSFEIKYKPLAEVAELADALGSGLSGRKLVRVQVPPSALPTVARQRLAERRVFCFLISPLGFTVFNRINLFKHKGHEEEPMKSRPFSLFVYFVPFVVRHFPPETEALFSMGNRMDTALMEW